MQIRAKQIHVKVAPGSAYRATWFCDCVATYSKTWWLNNHFIINLHNSMHWECRRGLAGASCFFCAVFVKAIKFKGTSCLAHSAHG